jgi:hypothetical protein
MGLEGFPRKTALRVPALLLVVAAIAFPGGTVSAGTTADRGPRSPGFRTRVPAAEIRGHDAVRFEPNRGQWDSRVRFLGRSPSCLVFLADGEAVFRLGGPGGGERSFLPHRDLPGSLPAARPGGDLRMAFAGASPSPRLEAGAGRPGTSNYFLGNDRARWRTGVPHFAAAAYRDLWPGVDLVFRGAAGADGRERFEYDLHLAPGADPAAVRFRFTGATGISIDEGGDLVLRTAAGEVRQSAPRLWQESGGKRLAVAGSFRLLADGTVGFDVGPRDRALALVVDPEVTYSTYLGGTGTDTSQDVVLDGTGKVIVTGYTASTDFPTQTPKQGANAGGTNDVYLVKYAADGKSLVFSTYLGGTGFDEVEGVAVDDNNNVILCGRTSSTDFPTASPYQAANAGGVADIFLLKLTPGGDAFHFSTYFGTTGQDESYDVAWDSTGIYLVGATGAADFPLTSPAQPMFGGGTADGLVMKFNTAGSAVTYCTYAGGSDLDFAVGVAVDSTGSAHATGGTLSSGVMGTTAFPTTGGAFQTAIGDPTNPPPTLGGDAFCLRLSSDGLSFLWSTFLGGSSQEICEWIALDSAGAVYLVGSTASTDFPIATAYQPAKSGGTYDAFVTKLNAGGSSLAFSTFYGGNGNDVTSGIGLDASGNVLLCGYTTSTDFPVSNAFQGTYQGGSPVNNDGFIVMMNASGLSVRYASFLGSAGGDDPRAMTLDSSGFAVVVGLTDSASFPVVNSQQSSIGGGAYDSYVMRIRLVPPAAPTACAVSNPGTGAVQVAWSDQSSNEVSFEIERMGIAGPFALIGTRPVNSTTYQDFAISPSTTYTYRVRAVNGDGSSAYTNEATITTPALVPPPTPPNNLTAAAQSPTQAVLGWNDRSSNENLFQVERRAVPGTFTTVASLDPDTIDWTDNGLLPDSHVSYRVRAVGVTTPSAWSAEAETITPGTMNLVLAKGTASDSESAGKDKAKAKGDYTYLPASPDDAIDPLNQAVTVMIGSEAAPYVITIPAGDLGWKLRNGKATWKSPRDSLTKTTVVFDLVKFKFSIAFSKIDFPGAVANPLRVSVRVGNDAGSFREEWNPGRKLGTFSYKP